MPKYNTFRYGQIGKYGQYNLTTTGIIGPYIRYRMRLINSNGEKGEFLTMITERIDIPSTSTIDRFRIAANDGEWVYMQSEVGNSSTSKVRIRSILSDGGYSEWVLGNTANLIQI